MEEIIRFYENIEKLNIKNKESFNYFNKFQNSLYEFSKIKKFDFKNRKIKKQKDLYVLLKKVYDDMDKVLLNWNKKVNMIIEEKKFEDSLENSFIVIVYGKVKAGKSTLGNFIAKNSFIKKLNKNVQFFVYDEKGNQKNINELQEIDEFKTDILECTNKIQGFKLDSLAWIDTPGLASMTIENEKLAKKYINAADFIIFPTSSDSPMQNTEINELKELIKYNKKFHIIITKSDTVEEDEVDGKIVQIPKNKSKEVRDLQENDVKKRLKENGIDIENIFSISIKMAKLGDLKGSNILKFYEFLNSYLLPKIEKLKGENRKLRIKGFIENDILKEIENLKKSFNEFMVKKEKIYKKIDVSKNNTKSDITSFINYIVSKNAKEIDKYNINEKINMIENEVNKELEYIIAKNLSEIFNELDIAFKDFVKESNKDLEIKDVYETFTYTNERIVKTSGSVAGAGAGAVIGAFLGGPIGSIVGSAIGGYLGSKVSESFITTHKGKVNVGDNRFEVINEYKNDLIKRKKEEIENFYNSLVNDFFKEVDNIFKFFKANLNNLENNIRIAL